MTRGQREAGGVGAGDVLAVFIVVIHQPVAVQAVHGQNDQHDEVGDHHGQVEGVGVVDAGEGPVGQLVPVVADGILGGDPQDGAESHECKYLTGFSEVAPEEQMWQRTEPTRLKRIW